MDGICEKESGHITHGEEDTYHYQVNTLERYINISKQTIQKHMTNYVSNSTQKATPNPRLH